MDVHSDSVGLVLLGACVALGYLLGSIPFGLVITRLAGLGDIRAIGSGNIGATNVLRTGRRDLAAATLLMDAGKAAIAYFVCSFITYVLGFHNYTDHAMFGVFGGSAAFVGHCYPVWLRFKGGKGVATFLGLLLAAVFPVGLIFAAVWLVTAGLFRMSSLAALAGTLAAWLVLILGFAPIGFTLADNLHAKEAAEVAQVVYSVLVVLIFWKHRANILRIVQGTEPKIGAGKKQSMTQASAAPDPLPRPEEIDPLPPSRLVPPGRSGDSR